MVRFTPKRTLLALATTSLLFSVGFANYSALSTTQVTPETSALICDTDLQHPIQVKVTPQNEIRNGQRLDLNVDVATSTALRNVTVKLTRSHGARLLDSVAAKSLGTLSEKSTGSSLFSVALPNQGDRFFLEFEIQGEGPTGMVTRGATYNILPNGPADPGTPVAHPSGETVLEYSAKRIDR
ncbi:MAG: hypothetical protein HKN21_05330 [Candidatus Eisenbacteria bacterium]|uniref:Cohesin domain-containing protein n=1 Tax=Eiseniibacteriota bacterium TaxID=2212470 RepID=A0A7Y2EDQ4_UNCEI|nr:hypothetical protein [Candidatus Eisenbacteria bacterium]